ncbi:MAG: GNAT family N-acetyltransferase [Chitinophagales bacterium]
MNHTKKTALKMRRCSSTDYQSIAKIYNYYILNTRFTMDDQPLKEQDVAGWVAHFNDRERLFVCKDGTETIGFTKISKYSHKFGYRFACETSIYFKPNLTGKGYGTFFQQALMDACKALGYKTLIAKIPVHNAGSIRFHRRFGFETVGVNHQIGWKLGEFVDIMMLQAKI